MTKNIFNIQIKNLGLEKKKKKNFLIANESSQDAVTINLHISQT